MDETGVNVQWFPGHMAKAMREMKEDIGLIDLVIEVVDARIPVSSCNPDLPELIAGKPHLILLNKCDMASDAATKEWIAFYKRENILAIGVDCKTGKGLSLFRDTVKTALKEKLEEYAKKGMVGKPPAMPFYFVPSTPRSRGGRSFSRPAHSFRNRP